MQATEDTLTILKNYTNAKRNDLIPILQNVQDKLGYIPRQAVRKIAEHLQLPASKIYGVITFYNQFRLQPIGRFHIMVCRGTACHVKGSKLITSKIIHELKINPGETTKDGLFTLTEVACIGACGLAPVISINNKFYAKVTPAKIVKIIAECRKESKNAE